MLAFMELVQDVWLKTTQWNTDNSYSTFNATSDAVLGFEIPRGACLDISSLSSPNFASSYSLRSTGNLSGALSYLYSSVRLDGQFDGIHGNLRRMVRGYRHLQPLRSPDQHWWWEVWQGGKRVDQRNTLLYGNIELPTSTLQSMFLRRINPHRQLRITCISNSKLPNGGALLAQIEHDVGKYSMDYLYSTDGGLLGLRGLYNFGPDPRDSSGAIEETQQLTSRLSAGAELYYGLLNKTGGLSAGLRFATLEAHDGVPVTATVTVNPLIGSISNTYAVQAKRDLTLCTKFDFNAYSYESGLSLGCELWKKTPAETGSDRTANGISAAPADPATGSSSLSPDASVFKARIDRNWMFAIVWQGKLKDLLFSIGTTVDLRRLDKSLQSVGLEMSYSR